MSTTLILGIGNTLFSDEGFGVYTIDYLLKHHPDIPDTTYLDGGTLSFTLAEPIAAHDNLVVIDATQLQATAGTMSTFIGPQMDRFLGGNRSSVHEVSLTDLLDIARLSDTLPERRALIGVQPASIDWGDRTTEAVTPALAQAAAAALQLHSDWQAHPPVAGKINA